MFNQRLLEARKKKGLTQKQLSDAAGIHPASYSAYETNKKVPPVDILVKIADTLDVSIDVLCGRKTESKMSTYGDIARALVHVFQALDGRYTIETGTPWGKTGEEAQITFWDEELLGFLKKAEKFDAMSKGSQDERELYFAWLEKKFSELDKKLLF